MRADVPEVERSTPMPGTKWSRVLPVASIGTRVGAAQVVSLVDLASTMSLLGQPLRNRQSDQLTYTVPVVDASDEGSPLKVSGTASFSEIRRQSAFQTASRLQILLKNASHKGIILLRATVTETGPHGPTKDQQIKRDHFFWGEMSAGSAIRLLGDEGRPANLSPVAPAREPKAKFRVQYVQFADGSIWGDELAAQDALATRSAIFGMLLRLQSEGNDRHLLALLREKIKPDEADQFFDSFRQASRDEGMAAVRQNVAAALRVASAHVSAMRQVQAKR